MKLKKIRRSMKGSANPNYHGGRVSLACERCGVAFSVPPMRASIARFCSLKCTNEWQVESRPGAGIPRKERAVSHCAVCRKEMRLLPSRVSRKFACSRECVRRMRLASPNIRSSARRGRREDLGGQFFRSSWEANYARFLNLLIQQGRVKSWEFEADTFWFEKIRRGVRSYTPDFKVTEPCGAIYYVEIKGWMDPKSITKIKRMAKYHPQVELRVVDSKAYKELDRLIGGAIPNWERAA